MSDQKSSQQDHLLLGNLQGVDLDCIIGLVNFAHVNYIKICRPNKQSYTTLMDDLTTMNVR